MPHVRVIVAVLLLSAAGAYAQTVPPEFTVTLAETSCFGTCPVYSVRIDATGNVTYDGQRHVRVSGRQQALAPIANVAALLETVERIKFFDLEDSYRSIKTADGNQMIVTDLPSTFVTVTLGKRTKRIEDYIGTPEALRTFERQIIDATRVRRWVRVDGTEVRERFSSGLRPSETEAFAMMSEALTYDDVDVIQALVDNGVDPNGSPSGSPLLLDARSVSAARVLLAAGADLGRLRSRSQGLLQKFSYMQADLAEILIAGVTKVDAPLNKDGRTALWAAACNGNIGVVNLLLAAGANPAARGNNKSAIECAVEQKAEEQRFPPFGRLPYVRDFDAVVAVMQQRLQQ
jgi:hypothetical protein